VAHDQLESVVRSIKRDGVNWGRSKLAPVAYGVQKLVINAYIEDHKISIEELQELMEALDLVQSTDVVYHTLMEKQKSVCSDCCYV
jgi:translation elongation factor EF-1beta